MTGAKSHPLTEASGDPHQLQQPGDALHGTGSLQRSGTIGARGFGRQPNFVGCQSPQHPDQSLDGCHISEVEEVRAFVDKPGGLTEAIRYT